MPEDTADEEILVAATFMVDVMRGRVQPPEGYQLPSRTRPERALARKAPPASKAPDTLL